MEVRPQISQAELPDASRTHMDFLDSKWFKSHGEMHPLPSPEYVRSFTNPRRHKFTVKFEELGLIIKGGSKISTLEAVNLRAAQRISKDQLRVPEVFGWRIHQSKGGLREVFIYMELIQGSTLEERWPVLSVHEKQAVCSDLRRMVSSFRNLRDTEPKQVIGSVCHGPAPDRCMQDLPLLRPFPDRKSLHDWYSWLWRRMVPDPQSIEDPWRDLLPDHGPIVWTHGDLCPVNIIVTASPARVAAIVDWEQAGWYPDYWEYCKARYTTSWDSEWRGYVDKFLDPHLDCLEAFDFYTCTLGQF